MNADTDTTNTDIQPRRRMTKEEQELYYDTKYPNRPICCFCGKKTDCPFGNNPAPIVKSGKCCGACNNVVIFVRMGIIPLPFAKKNKKNLRLLYDLVVQTNPEPPS